MHTEKDWFNGVQAVFNVGILRQLKTWPFGIGNNLSVLYFLCN